MNMSVKLKPLAPAPTRTHTRLWYYHSWYCSRKTSKRKNRSCRSRNQRKSYHCKGRRYCSLWKICRYRTKIRR